MLAFLGGSSLEWIDAGVDAFYFMDSLKTLKLLVCPGIPISRFQDTLVSFKMGPYLLYIAAIPILDTTMMLTMILAMSLIMI